MEPMVVQQFDSVGFQLGSMRHRSVVRGCWGGAIPPWMQCIHNALTENNNPCCDRVAPLVILCGSIVSRLLDDLSCGLVRSVPRLAESEFEKGSL